jgi:hypothetical protein
MARISSAICATNISNKRLRKIGPYLERGFKGVVRGYDKVAVFSVEFAANGELHWRLLRS